MGWEHQIAKRIQKAGQPAELRLFYRRRAVPGAKTAARWDHHLRRSHHHLLL